jgi:class 3 adenylate cyclase/predicted ATPase
MTFDEVLAQVQALLQREKRVSYRGLKRRFALDDEYLEDLKEELIGAKRQAADEDGRFLVWTGGQEPAVALPSVPFLAPSLPTGPRPAEAERRQLTVMFCDLVGSTALSERLDPEELREVVHAYHQVSAEAIGRFAGQVAQHLGDGLLVYFGYPQAHEDDAQRAVRAGLGIVAAIQQAPLLQHHSVQVRIGIHTGPVVVGEIGSGSKRENLALGETPNVAARVQGVAEPDTVVISAATYRLIEGFFACRSLGPSWLKGISTPVEVYQALEESEAQSRLEVAATKGLTPLVGREQEVGLLLEGWRQVKEGAGQVVLLSGEAGIGKSRLVQVLKEHLVGELHVRLDWRCSPYYQNTAFYPVIEHLQRLLGFNREDSAHGKLTKLERVLESYGFALPEVVPLFAALLSLPLTEHYAPLTLTPQRQKQKAQEAMLAWLLKETQRQPVHFTVEDLHWADASTLELLGLLIDQAPTTRLLLVLVFRPEFSSPWASHSQVMLLTLSRLARKQVETMIERVTGGKGLPTEVLQQLVMKTDGVPLFVEELTKTVLESGLMREVDGHYELTGSLPSLAIPPTLHDSLMARLDRLSTVKEVAQLGAALGREFTYELIQAVSPLDETLLQRELARLVEAELLYQRGLPPRATYLFKHALIQEEAYQSLLKSKRQQYHTQIASVLEEHFPETMKTQPELLAHHYSGAGLLAQAIPYWHQAGQRAVQRSANAEALSHLTKGLEALTALPNTPERIQQELTLQIAMGGPLIAMKGYTAPEVEKTYTRALELCRQAGETPHLFSVLWGLRLYWIARAELHTAQELGEQLLSLAQRAQDTTLLVEGHRALGDTLFYLGELVPAHAHFEQAMTFYDHQQHHSYVVLYGQDPAVACLSYTALALWLLGYPDRARERSSAALTLAQELSHPYSQALALNLAATLHQYCREGLVVQEGAEAVIALSSEQGFLFRVAWGTLLRGWALTEQGYGEQGLAQLRQGLAFWQATGAELVRPHCLAMLAETYGKVGQVEEGLSVLAEALAAVDKTGQGAHEAELYRLKGELVLQSSVRSLESKVQEAEGCFQQAIAIACRQRAKSWELRATTSLARLWQQQGKTVEAHQMLAEIYGWFTEGFETRDLKEAKALLTE